MTPKVKVLESFPTGNSLNQSIFVSNVHRLPNDA
jgi:hypothetical protein